jgi:hypothetical protein
MLSGIGASLFWLVEYRAAGLPFYPESEDLGAHHAGGGTAYDHRARGGPSAGAGAARGISPNRLQAIAEQLLHG